MSKTNLTENFWQAFCAKNPDADADEPYQVWYFGNTSEMAKELVALVLQGKKTATASLFWEYENKREDEPIVDGYSVVTDFEGTPVCILRTTELRVLPFNEVDEQFAFDEGEGDRTLEYWRRVHRKFFSEYCRESGVEFEESMLVSCKRFNKLFPEL